MAGRPYGPAGRQNARACDERTMLPAKPSNCRKQTKKPPDKPILPIAGNADSASFFSRGGGFTLLGAHTGFPLLAVLVFLVSTIAAQAGCIDQAQVVATTVRISRSFYESERVGCSR